MKKLYIFINIAMALAGCSLDIRLEDQFSDPYAITDTETARELLASAYNSLPRFQMEFSVLSDDFYPTALSQKYVEMLNLYNWQEKAISDFSSNVWSEYYMVVAVVNALLPRLELLEAKTDRDAVEIARIRSEAHALKAMCYFDLVRLYGPIVLKDRLEYETLPRSSVEECLEEIDRLLDEAEKVDDNDAAVFYMSTEAVKALRVEFELHRGNYDVAVAVAQGLLEGAESRWTKSSFENLWSGNESDDRIFAPYIFESFYTDLCYDRTKGDYFILSDQVRYDEDDLRQPWSEYAVEMSSGLVRALGKYNRMYYENTTVRYINTMRYSGVCFAAAEAYARSRQYGQAVDMVNRLLGAYGAVLIDESLEGEALIEAILAEKHKEFVGEGVRYFDLKRMGKPLKRYKNLGTSVNSTIAADDYRWLFPIPESEYKYNDLMDQNPEWPFIKTE
ncbi:MAG: RagB/SusD family nutrient uptake outer membrane protein [Bacteroidales bacterium]|nr:RagB/SusD family nutrient uptake outer membrane protein [Bacteroidales bacterium]